MVEGVLDRAVIEAGVADRLGMGMAGNMRGEGHAGLFHRLGLCRWRPDHPPGRPECPRGCPEGRDQRAQHDAADRGRQDFQHALRQPDHPYALIRATKPGGEYGRMLARPNLLLVRPSAVAILPGMGTNVALLSRIIDRCLGERPWGKRSYLDLGSQHLFGGTTGDYVEFTRAASGLDVSLTAICSDLAARSTGTRTDQAFCAELFDFVAWDYQSVDLHNGTIKADLNYFDVPDDMLGSFDFVANFGTTEHVFDQLRCFRAIHDAAKVGGHMIHILPMSGMLYHCLFAYNPKFYLLLAEANGYEILHAGAYDQMTRSAFDDRHAAWAQYEILRDAELHDILGEFIFRKTTDAPFRLPYDVKGNDPVIAISGAHRSESLRV